MAADARATLEIMSTKILEPDVQARIDTFMRLPRDPDGRRLHGAVMAAHAAKQQEVAAERALAETAAQEETASFASSLGLARSRSGTPVSPPPEPRRQVARRGKQRKVGISTSRRVSRSRSASIASSAQQSETTIVEQPTNQVAVQTPTDAVPLQVVSEEGPTSPPRSEIASAAGGMDLNMSLDSTLLYEADPYESKPTEH